MENGRDYKVVIRDCPRRIRAFTVKNRSEDFYTIVLSSALNEVERLKAFAHECRHIERNDFDPDVNVELAEITNHEDKKTNF